MNHKKFTLIELIVVIAILGILAGVIIPNISNIKTDAKKVSITADTRNIQTAVTVFSTENMGNLPTKLNPTLTVPVEIDFDKLVPKYLRKTPEKGHYWIDFTGGVWSSTADSPINYTYENGVIKFNIQDENIIAFNLYGTDLTNGVANNNIQFIKRVNASDNMNGVINIDVSDESYKTFLVSSVDIYNAESAPVGIDYSGVTEDGNQNPVVEEPSIELDPASNNYIVVNKTIIGNSLIPMLDPSNTSGTIVVSASSSNSGYGVGPFSAFNNQDLWNLSWFSDVHTYGVSPLNEYLQVDFGQKQKVSSFAIENWNDTTTTHPKSWKLIGSNNEIDWFVLYEEDNGTVMAPTETRQYFFNGTANYRYYRLSITERYGDTYVSVGNLALFE